MPVYRLTPVEGTEASPRWQASSIRPHCLWVQAEDEQKARETVARATAVTPFNGHTPPEPWGDESLVACEYDESKDVARGIIRIRRAA